MEGTLVPKLGHAPHISFLSRKARAKTNQVDASTVHWRIQEFTWGGGANQDSKSKVEGEARIEIAKRPRIEGEAQTEGEAREKKRGEGSGEGFGKPSPENF